MSEGIQTYKGQVADVLGLSPYIQMISCYLDLNILDIFFYYKYHRIQVIWRLPSFRSEKLFWKFFRRNWSSSKPMFLAVCNH